MRKNGLTGIYLRNVVSVGAPSENNIYRLNVSASYLVKYKNSYYIIEIGVPSLYSD
jgi:hypothetical protein